MREKIANILHIRPQACALACALLIGACGGGTMEQTYTPSPAFMAVPPSSWERLAGKRIFFGHQSVGEDIVAGLGEIAAEQRLAGLNIIEGTALPAGADGVPPAPAFLHAAIGTNGDPAGKLDRFSELMLGELGETVDIAFFKFCYLDITAGTDVPRLFASYQRHLSRLKEARPDVTFIHVTVPLTALQTGPRAFVKRLLKKPPGGYRDNAKRNEFNLLMCLAYAGEEPFFDLALIESTQPGGSRVSYTFDGRQHFSLSPAYTDDGGHLNAAGRHFAAEHLLLLLTQL